MRLAGHLETVFGHLRRLRQRIELPPADAWETEVADPDFGSVRLTGALTDCGGSEAVIIVHGLGGGADSGYIQSAAAAVSRRGVSSLRLNLRGADRLGEDYYHGGLTADLGAAVASPELAVFERLSILGFSLGGHVALRYLLEGGNPRLSGVAAICAPLDLAACCDWIDRPLAWIYRRYLLSKLMEIYRPVAARREVPLAVEEAARIRSQREFDDRVIAPRHGFAGVDDYYRKVSVGPRLAEIDARVLLVMGRDDPMIPRSSQVRHLSAASPTIDVRWVRGGHVAFPPRLSLGEEGPRGLEEQVATWLVGPGPEPGAGPAAC